MTENQEEYYSMNDMIKISSLFVLYVKRKYFFLIAFVVLGALLGLVYYNFQKPKYEAVCTFILEEKSSGGGIAGIASQFGFDISSLGSGGNIFAGDNILDILKSKKVLQKVLLSKVDKNSSNSPSLSDVYADFTGLRKEWEKETSLRNIYFNNENQNTLSPKQDSLLYIIYNRVLKKNLSANRYNKKGTIIKVQITAEHDQFAKLMTERLVDEASSMYLEIKVGTEQKNIMTLQRRSDSLLSLLNRKTYTAAAVQQIDLNPGIRTANVQTELAGRDKMIIATLYSEITKNLETSKLLLSQQTPIIQILDRPGLALSDNKKSLIVLIAIFSAVSLFIFLAWAILYVFFIGFNSKTND